MSTLVVLAAIAALARTQHGAFSRAQADALGANDGLVARSLASGLWARRGRGVYALTSHRRTPEQRLMVSTLAIGGDVFVSGVCVLALRGIDGFHLGGDPLEVLVVGANRSVRSRVVRAHRTVHLPEDQRTVIRNLPCTTLARAYVDAARTLPGRRLARAVDDGLLTRKVSVGSILAVLSGLPANGRAGSAVLGRLLDARSADADVPPESELEARSLEIACGAGLPVPIMQAPPPWRTVEHQRVDLLWAEAKLILECDGRRWHARMEAFAADRRRDRQAERHGYGLVRVTWEDVELFAEELADDLVAIYQRRLGLTRSSA